MTLHNNLTDAHAKHKHNFVAIPHLAWNWHADHRFNLETHISFLCSLFNYSHTSIHLFFRKLHSYRLTSDLQTYRPAWRIIAALLLHHWKQEMIENPPRGLQTLARWELETRRAVTIATFDYLPESIVFVYIIAWPPRKYIPSVQDAAYSCLIGKECSLFFSSGMWDEKWWGRLSGGVQLRIT